MECHGNNFFEVCSCYIDQIVRYINTIMFFFYSNVFAYYILSSLFARWKMKLLAPRQDMHSCKISKIKQYAEQEYNSITKCLCIVTFSKESIESEEENMVLMRWANIIENIWTNRVHLASKFSFEVNHSKIINILHFKNDNFEA